MIAPVIRFIPLSQAVQRLGQAIGLVLLLLLCSCTIERSTKIDLTMQVEASNRPGVYLVSGRTNLPERTQVTVEGVRYLGSASSSAPDSLNYSILARQVVEVSKGQWQATLNLWQVAPDGRYQEAWQLKQPQVGAALQPSSEVTFLAITDPANRSRVLEQQLEDQGKTLKGDNVHFTADGQWYVQASQTMAASLPTGKTTPPAPEKVDAVAASEPAGAKPIAPISADLKQTTAPLPVEAYLR